MISTWMPLCPVPVSASASTPLGTGRRGAKANPHRTRKFRRNSNRNRNRRGARERKTLARCSAGFPSPSLAARLRGARGSPRPLSGAQASRRAVRRPPPPGHRQPCLLLRYRRSPPPPSSRCRPQSCRLIRVRVGVVLQFCISLVGGLLPLLDLDSLCCVRRPPFWIQAIRRV
jgi:hypothetical protein